MKGQLSRQIKTSERKARSYRHTVQLNLFCMYNLCYSQLSEFHYRVFIWKRYFHIQHMSSLVITVVNDCKWPSCPFIESLFPSLYCRYRSAVVFPPSVQFELLLPARTTAESSAAVEQLQTTEPKLLRVGVMSRQGSQWGCSWGIGRGPGWGRPAPEWGKGIHWG